MWGLDFGTTTTFLSESDLVGSRNYSLREASGTWNYLPSVVRIAGESLTFGASAADGPEEGLFRSVKRAITLKRQTLPLPEPQELETTPDTGPVCADDAIRGLLAEVKRIAGVEIGSRPIRLGCPAMWDADQRNRLLRLAAEAGFTVQHDTLIDEPVAACMGWFDNEFRHGRRPTGTTLVFDMGGGTLDVAALRINSDHESPEIYVLASDGIDEAGDALDAALARVLLEKQEKGSQSEKLLIENPGWLRRSARLLKVQLGDAYSTATKLRLPGGEVVELELTEDDLRSAFEPQFENALDLVQNVLRMARMADWRESAMTGPELRAIKLDQLLSQVDHFLLVGGMSQMPLLRRLLIESGVSAEKIFGRESLEPNEAVSAGLALSRDYDHLSLDRPGFNFELQWKRAGAVQTELIYRAYTRLYTREQARTFLPLKLTWRNEHLETDDADEGGAVFGARTTRGEIIELDFDGELKENLGPFFHFGLNKSPVIIIQPNGRIFMRDGTGAEFAFRVARWPVLNATKKRTLTVKPSDTSGDSLSGLAWHERPYD